jgi:hypothetical protein
MRRFATSCLAVALGIGAAVALVSCGGGSSAKLLPGNTAREITQNLDAVAEFARSGDCTQAQDAVQQVSGQIDALGGVDKQLKRALRDGAAHLNDVVVANCAATSVATTPDLSTTTESTSPSEKPKKEKKPKKVETTPTAPTTTPTVTTPTSTTPTTPTPPTTPPGPPDGGGTGPPSGGVGPDRSG